HGEQGVTLRSNNEYEEGGRVTMPDDRPKSQGGMFDEKGNNNDGIMQALGQATPPPKLATIENITSMIAQLKDPTSDIRLSPVADEVNFVTLSNQNSFSMDLLVQGAVNVFTCGKGSASTIQIPGDSYIENT